MACEGRRRPCMVWPIASLQVGLTVQYGPFCKGHKHVRARASTHVDALISKSSGTEIGLAAALHGRGKLDDGYSSPFPHPCRGEVSTACHAWVSPVPLGVNLAGGNLGSPWSFLPLPASSPERILGLQARGFGSCENNGVVH